MRSPGSARILFTTKTRRIAKDFFASSCLRGEIFWLRLGCTLFIGGFFQTFGCVSAALWNARVSPTCLRRPRK